MALGPYSKEPDHLHFLPCQQHNHTGIKILLQPAGPIFQKPLPMCRIALQVDN